MDFVKGVVVGSLMVTGITMMCTESGQSAKKRMMKKGRQMFRKMNVM